MSELACQNESRAATASAGESSVAPTRFTCFLDDYPDHLVPQRYLREEAITALDVAALSVNPQLVVARLEDLPVGVVDASLLDNFKPGEDMVWIPEADTKALAPFWMRAKFSAIVSDLVAGRKRAEDLEPNARIVLQMARILRSKENVRVDTQEATDGICALFQGRGYAPVSGLIHPFHLSALRKYYRSLIRKGHLKLGDDQSEGRYISHNEKVAVLFHHQLTHAVTAIVGEPVQPSYVYFASYQSGARLEKHIDREQCKFTLSLCLDYSPEPWLHTPWPLQLHTTSSIVSVYQGLGDGVVYRGCEIPHSREPLAEGNTSTSLFFHYVSSDFKGSVD
jgi:hypothetical protein